MNILAIESSCDEISAAIVRDDFYVQEHCIFSSALKAAQTGGVIPEIAAREAGEKAVWVVDQVCNDFSQIDAIAVTTGPGLAGSLMVGIYLAKTLAYMFQKPLIPVHHIYGHLSANFLWDEKTSPSQIPEKRLILTVSGGHNDIVLWENGRVKKVGYTLDDAAGECFDKCARMLDLPYPGGPHLSQKAEKGNMKAFDFPRPMIHSKDGIFSFSGLKTSLLYKIKELGGIENINHQTRADLSASIQKAIVDTLLLKLFLLSEQSHITHLEITGGVSANTLLRQEFSKKCEDLGCSYTIPRSLSFCTDNAAMIGAGAVNIKKYFPEQKWDSEDISLMLSQDFPLYLSL